MENTQLHIKNMVCNRCITVVKDELEKLGLHVEKINLGEVVLGEHEEEVDRAKIVEALTKHGFQLLDDKKSLIIEKIKTTVIELIHHQEKAGGSNFNFSYLIEEKVGMDYTYLSSLFSTLEGVTLEKYIINQKVEKVKELLVYGELNLSEIAYQMGYSSVQHLSTQFKKVTGLTPSHFKKIKESKRLPLDEV
ncbi:MAG TPA: AraC family transcriptional regulator [Cytophagales bacterium]|nr:AraC family transcriptional regulator [Cytophagales bacterium]